MLTTNSGDLRTKNSSTVQGGLKLGVVKSVEDPDNLNRLIITIVDEGLDTFHARVMTDFASGEAGSVKIPQVGEEVIVAFLGGEFSDAVVLGGVYSMKNKPPMKIDKDNNIWYAKTYAGTEITVDNKKDKQIIDLKTKKGHKITLNDDEESLMMSSKDSNTAVAVDFKNGEVIITADKKITISAGKQDQMVLEANKGLTVKSAAGAVKVEAKDINFNAKANLEGSANAKVAFSGNASAEISSSGQTVIKGSITKIN